MTILLDFSKNFGKKTFFQESLEQGGIFFLKKFIDFSGVYQPLAMILHLLHQFLHTDITLGFGSEDRWLPASFRVHIHFQHHRQLTGGLVRAITVGFVYHEEVSDLQNASLDGLNIVAHTRHHHHQGGMRQSDNINFILPDPYRLDDDHIHSHGIHDISHVSRRAGESSHVATGGEAPDEDAFIVCMTIHPDSVPEYGTTGKGTRRIDGNDTHPLTPFPVGGGDLIHQRGFSCAWRPGDTYKESIACMRKEILQFGAGAGKVIVDVAHEACGGTNIARQNSFSK